MNLQDTEGTPAGAGTLADERIGAPAVDGRPTEPLHLHGGALADERIGAGPAGPRRAAVPFATLASERVGGVAEPSDSARPLALPEGGFAAERILVEPAATRVVRSERRPLPWRAAFKLVPIAIGVLILVSLLWVVVYRFVEPPTTATMIARGFAGADVRRVPVPLAAISPNLVRAVVAAEDTRFCAHGGFDGAAIARAVEEARGGRGLRGASTISQQTAKNAFLWTGGGWARKGAEAGFTGLVELIWPKPRIMEVYLNAAEWGDGVFGAEAAARVRFGKSAAELSVREAALLAAVLPSPNRWRLDPPGPYVASRAATIEARMGVVQRDGLAACVLGAP